MRKLTLAQVKALAKKNPDGVIVELYSSKANPQSQWISGYQVKVEAFEGKLHYRDSEDELNNFENLLDYYKHYNCSNYLGNTVHYYLVEELG